MRRYVVRILIFAMGIALAFSMMPEPLSAVVYVKRTINKEAKQHRGVNRKIKSEIFKAWKGNTLITETGQYPLSPSVRIYDYAETRSTKKYDHQPIVDFVFINHELKKVVIRPCQ